MDYLWTWGGKFFGYRQGDLLYTAHGQCVGQFSGDEVYGTDGRYLGELRRDRLITNISKRGWSGPAAPNVHGGAIGGFVDYVGYVMYLGHEDFPSFD